LLRSNVRHDLSVIGRAFGILKRKGRGKRVEENKVAAAFRNGVLTAALPKFPAAQQKVKRIAINGKEVERDGNVNRLVSGRRSALAPETGRHAVFHDRAFVVLADRTRSAGGRRTAALTNRSESQQSLPSVIA
jgi:hypothetical protein